MVELGEPSPKLPLKLTLAFEQDFVRREALGKVRGQPLLEQGLVAVFSYGAVRNSSIVSIREGGMICQQPQ